MENLRNKLFIYSSMEKLKFFARANLHIRFNSVEEF